MLHTLSFGLIPVGAPWLPVAFALIMAFIILMYVLLDGFDLGIGVLFALERDPANRDVMVNSIAPVWDGNETWLVLGGSTLYGAFPEAYSVILPAVYPLVILMLMGLIFRGTAFEFRFRAPSEKLRRLWDWGFLAGSVVASFCQGAILGGIMQGTAISNSAYAGGALNWISPFSMFCGVAVVIGYALLGATWIIWRASGPLQLAMRGYAKGLGVAMLGLFAVVGLWSPFLNPDFYHRWFVYPGIYATAVAPLCVLVLAYFFFTHLQRKDVARADKIPFFCALGWFVVSFGGLGYSIFPQIVPPGLNIWQAAAPLPSEQFLFPGVVILLPIILGYNMFAYYVFRGKIEHGAHYH
ncbi:MAG: cytochrome d ubiquinol oxidase subunit II [Acidocella sp.]|nr:cytochrome d ubiquinol oxidase subunit II [Acidocella sp.]